MMKVYWNEVPEEIKKCMINKQIDIVVETIKNAGLLKEFSAFIVSEETNCIRDIDELCVAFAKKFPDKFSIVPPEQRYDFCVYNNMEEARIEEIHHPYDEENERRN